MQLAAIKSFISVHDESLETNLAGSLHLSMQQGGGEFSWALLSTADNKYLALESYFYNKTDETNPLDELKNKPWYKNLATVSVALVSDKITLVPEPLFHETTKLPLSRLSFDTAENTLVLAQKVRSAGCYAVFALEKETAQVYKTFFAGIKILHASMPLLERLPAKDKNEAGEKAYLHIRPKSIELLVTKAGALLYYNTFSYTTSEDVIYYLLFALEQLKLNPEAISLQLLGEVDKNDGNYSIVHKYVRHVSFMERNTRFEYSYRFSELPAHAYYSLFSQYLCV